MTEADVAVTVAVNRIKIIIESTEPSTRVIVSRMRLLLRAAVRAGLAGLEQVAVVQSPGR